MPITCFTVDVEDWFHVCGVKKLPFIPADQKRVFDNTMRLLDLFEELGIRSTFFVLGSVAKAEPKLARRITERGHEVASHGFSHKLVYELTPEQFKAEVVSTGDLLAAQSGKKVVGYRAPQWSIGVKTPWAFDILSEEGYLYDSSCSPLPFIGNSKGPVTPYVLSTASGKLWEIPPLVTSTVFGNLPSGGGWGLRVLPYKVIMNGVKKMHSNRDPAVFFLHPREIDPKGPRLRLNLIKKFAAYGTRTDVSPVVRLLSGTGESVPLREMVESWRSAF